MSEQEDLFKVEESISPMAAFIKKHGINTHYAEHMVDEEPWSAFKGKIEDWIGYDDLITGGSKEEVVYQFAKKYGLEGWDKLDWS